METINDLFGPIAANDNKPSRYIKQVWCERQCQNCGDLYRGPTKQKFCSKQCKSRSRNIGRPIINCTCVVCGDNYESTQNSNYCSTKCASRKRMDELNAAAECRICPECGKDYRNFRKEQIFCSKSCSLGSRTRAKALDDLVAAILDGAKPSNVNYTVYKQRCVICDGWHTKRGTVCSDECRLSANRNRENEKNSAAHALIDRECNECGITFAPEYGSKRRNYCSHACMRKHGRRVGKASRAKRIRSGISEPVSHTRVFESAGWMCVVCGVDTPRELRGSNDNNAPELDHIVPLARGGSHTYSNVQCLCRACNGSKSDMLMDEWRHTPPPRPSNL